MADALKPYADDETSMTVGGLTIENGTDRISFSGSLDLARDQRGLDHARALHGLLTAVVAALEAAGDLPAQVSAPKPAAVTRKANPFA